MVCERPPRRLRRLSPSRRGRIKINLLLVRGRRERSERGGRSHTILNCPAGGNGMKLGLEGKVVLITGGSKGIGLACARAFASEGSRVAIASRSEENLEAARQTLAHEGFEVITARADFINPDEAQSAAARTEKLLGPIDVLINSAGAAKRRPWEKLDS